ncbi:hypothetical protein, partial [Streptomyces noursei]
MSESQKSGRRKGNIMTTDHQNLSITEALINLVRRRSELATRPVLAELSMHRVFRTGVVRLFADGHAVRSDRDIIRFREPLTEITQEVLDRSEKLVLQRGFQTTGEWAPHVDNATVLQVRIPIKPTPTYLAYVERAYGAVPQLPELSDGWEATPNQRGGWILTAPGGASF